MSTARFTIPSDKVSYTQLAEIKNHAITIYEEKKPLKKTPKTLLGLLQRRQKDLHEAINLLQKSIKKRKVTIYILMCTIMAGTAVFLIYHQIIKYQEFKDQEDDHNNELRNSLNALLAQAKSNATELENFYNQLKTDFQALNTTLIQMTDTLKSITKKVICWDHPSMHIISCQDRLRQEIVYRPSRKSYFNLCVDRGIPNDCRILDGHFDTCPSVINQFCEITLSLPEKSIHLSDSYKLFKAAMEVVATLSNQINNIIFNDDAFYSAFGGVVGYWFIILGLGEISPLTFILLTLLTKVTSDVITDHLTCVDLNEEGQALVETAGVDWEGQGGKKLSHSKMLRRLQEAEQNNKQEILIEENAAEKYLAIHQYMSVGVSEMIYLMADVPDLNRASLNLFRSGGSHPKNELEQTPDGGTRVNPLFSFWTRLAAEENGGKVARNIYDYARFAKAPAYQAK